MLRTRFIVPAVFLILLTACSGLKVKLFTDATAPLNEYTLEGSGEDKVLLISLEGVISDHPEKGLIRTSPSAVEKIVSRLRKAEKDNHVKSVLLKINSSGGAVTASDLLYHEILSFKEKTGAKVVVSMMDLAASGAYYLSLPADMIMAHPTTVTGSVGVIFLIPKVQGLMDKVGLEVAVTKSGGHKDMGSPFRTDSKEERDIMQQVVDEFGKRFVDLVQKHRRLEKEALTEVSTARVFTAQEALKLGLVDKIGYLNDAVGEAKKMAGLAADARVVVYRREEYPEDNYYNVAEARQENATPATVNIIQSGFYYLWIGSGLL